MGIVPNSIDNAIENLTNAPTKIIGTTLADLWTLVFGNISHEAEKRRLKYANDLRIFALELEEKEKEIPAENKIEPDLQTTAQALECSKYCISSEELRQMFVNLISGTMNKEMQSHIHPSFPEILKQMSPNDAIFLKQVAQATQFVPVMNIGTYTPNGRSHVLFYKDVFVPMTDILSIEDHTLSASSLSKHGIVSISYESYLSNDSAYTAFENLDIYLAIKEKAIQSNLKLYIQKGVCSLTTLGIKFAKACL